MSDPQTKHRDHVLQDKRRATWAGVAVNLPLAVGKIGVGWLAGSQALVADGVHSLSDLVSDAAVLWALAHSHRPPDAEHPFGHGRFETVATLVVAMMLGVATVGIVIDSGLRMDNPPDAAPDVVALWAAAASILMKEALYHYTSATGRRTRSALMIANAWHHRSDALSSAIALAGIGAAMAGLTLADAVAAAVIALLLGRIAWRLGRPALAELVDAAPGEDAIRRVEAEILAVPGVRDVHDLRLRRSGGVLRGDGHVSFDGSLALSEAHRLTEAARARVRAAVPEVFDILLHAEPEGHADGPAAHAAPLRPEVQLRLCTELASVCAGAEILALRLDYRDDRLTVELVIDGPIGDEVALRKRLEACLDPLLPMPASIVMTGPITRCR